MTICIRCGGADGPLEMDAHLDPNHCIRALQEKISGACQTIAEQAVEMASLRAAVGRGHQKARLDVEEATRVANALRVDLDEARAVAKSLYEAGAPMRDARLAAQSRFLDWSERGGGA